MDRIAHYSLGVGGPLYQSIWVDSTTVDSSLRTYHLNRVSKINLQLMNSDFGDGELYDRVALLNEGQFMQEKVTELGDKSWKFEGRTTYYIDLNVGGKFYFGTEENLEAEVIHRGVLNVFDSPDSVATIRLSNGEFVQISKNNGILQFPVGKDTSANVHLLGFQDDASNFSLRYFMDWHAGDFFQIKYGSITHGHSSEYQLDNYIIKERMVKDGKVEFRMEHSGVSCSNCLYWQSVDTTYSYHTYETQGLALNDSLLFINGFHVDGSQMAEHLNSVFRFSNLHALDGFGLVYKTLYWTSPYLEQKGPASFMARRYSSSDTLFLRNPSFWSHPDNLVLAKFVQGAIGETNFGYEFTKYKIGDHLFNVGVGQEELQINGGEEPFPNPTRSVLNIPQGWKGPYRIFDIRGKQHGFEKEGNKINLQPLNSGVYLLIAGDQTFRFVKE